MEEEKEKQREQRERKKKEQSTGKRTNEPNHEKTCFLHMLKQRRRSAAQ